MLCALLLNDECEILDDIFTKFPRLFNASAAHVQTYIAIATYTVCIIYTCVYNMYAAGTRTRTVIADRTLDVSSGLQLHGVVGNKYIIQLMTVEYSVILYNTSGQMHFHEPKESKNTFAHEYNITPYSTVMS